ncbi:unnamed protein product [Coffea canephora]|uniref:RHOMBOID-like protein n=1 Tax=Coffea canephora TaxID=49390 RepID=A0A068V1Y3_COFCA|nr:unnamed protein product [Coffea canephora]
MLIVRFHCDCTVRVGAIYLLSGIGASILSCIFIHCSISAGASGALFGLLGAILSELLTNWTIYSNKYFFFWLTSTRCSSPKSKYTVYQYVLVLVALVLLIIGFTVGLVMLFRGENGNDHCSWCHSIKNVGPEGQCIHSHSDASCCTF